VENVPGGDALPEAGGEEQPNVLALLGSPDERRHDARA
jgi:hypothetical protein